MRSTTRGALGFSHDARGPSKFRNGRVVVESIDQVLSVDLVANPATTSGLFEDRTPEPAVPTCKGDVVLFPRTSTEAERLAFLGKSSDQDLHNFVGRMKR